MRNISCAFFIKFKGHIICFKSKILRKALKLSFITENRPYSNRNIRIYIRKYSSNSIRIRILKRIRLHFRLFD